MLRFIRPVLALVIVVSLAGCAMRARSIADIRDDPGRYDNRQVEVTGRVTSAWSVPLVPYGMYKIDDGSACLNGFRTPLTRRNLAHVLYKPRASQPRRRQRRGCVERG